MKVIIDANVAISAVASRGLCEAVMELCLEQHRIILCKEILVDVKEKLIQKIHVPQTIADDYLKMLLSCSEIHVPENIRSDICRDPDDKVILGLVKPSNASFIITGDKDLLVLGSYLDAKIVSPRQFWDENVK
ncbi:MAG: putative toxin-antitoxin system toxin component, PIN family [Victivallales bacterium]